MAYQTPFSVCNKGNVYEEGQLSSTEGFDPQLLASQGFKVLEPNELEKINQKSSKMNRSSVLTRGVGMQQVPAETSNGVASTAQVLVPGNPKFRNQGYLIVSLTNGHATEDRLMLIGDGYGIAALPAADNGIGGLASDSDVTVKGKFNASTLAIIQEVCKGGGYRFSEMRVEALDGTTPDTTFYSSGSMSLVSTDTVGNSAVVTKVDLGAIVTDETRNTHIKVIQQDFSIGKTDSLALRIPAGKTIVLYLKVISSANASVHA